MTGVALFGVVIASTLPVSRGVFAVVPIWLSVTQFTLGVGLLALTSFADGYRSLQTLSVGVVTVQAQWLLIQFSVADEVFGLSSAPDTVEILVAEAVQFAPALVALAALGVAGYSRSDLLLRLSDRSQTTDFTWIPGVQTEWSWRRATLVLGVFLVSAFLVIRMIEGVSYEFGAHNSGELAVIVPAILVASAMNSFMERTLFAALPLRELTDALGKSRALLILAVFFGLSHFTGTPGGPLGVFLTGILGWVLAKLMIETRSIVAAWILHFCLDILIFTAVLT
ncbi:MAG: CAAX amino terminal protease family [halophilic archaeon J07HX64]|nr:MAG: CAAX amino terminal protease family [halophilic archaeon J07HX64]